MNPNPPDGARVISFAIGKTWIDEDGFCRIRFTTDSAAHMGVPEVREMGEAVYKICEGKKHKHLVDSRGVLGAVLPGAREEVRNNENINTCRSAAAMVIDNIANKLIINFFIRFNKPAYPYKAFESADEAVKWLKSV